MKTVTLSVLLITFSLSMAFQASAECFIDGNIVAEMENHPLGDYTYTMTVHYDMDSQHGLSHLVMVVDGAGGTCDCSDIGNAVHFDDVAGFMTVPDECHLDFQSELLCDGDPSIGVEGILFKFEPIEAECGEPGPSGTITFVFYSDMSPAPINDEAVSMIDKAAGETCSGGLTGVFPGLVCDPVSNDSLHFGSLKVSGHSAPY